MKKFIAKNVVVMKFSDQEDEDGTVYPPECHVILPNGEVDVTFQHDHNIVVGKALIFRKGNKLLANFKLMSHMENGVEALRLMKMLYPSIEAQITDVHKNMILAMKILSVSLIVSRNIDSTILPLGNSVVCADKPTREGLH